MCPIAPNALWALDFQFDTTVDGRTIKLLNIVDEYTRECPAIVVDRSIDADKVVATLDRIALQRGFPAFVRFDSRPEFIANAVADWCRNSRVGSIFIDPGSPCQNAWIESFHGRLRDEFLNGWTFDNLLEAQVLIEDWRIDYNQHRPHSAHGDLTPSEFARAWTTRYQPALAERLDHSRGDTSRPLHTASHLRRRGGRQPQPGKTLGREEGRRWRQEPHSCC